MVPTLKGLKKKLYKHKFLTSVLKVFKSQTVSFPLLGEVWSVDPPARVRPAAAHTNDEPEG